MFKLQSHILFLFSLAFICLSLVQSRTSPFRIKNAQGAPSPVVGVLTQPSEYTPYPSSKYSYIAASYIKYLEAAGFEVVPIQWDLPFDKIDKLLSKINGVLFPGGATTLVTKNPPGPSTFAKTGLHIVEKALEFNRKGDYFPIWSTCLGYELLVLTMSGNYTLLIDIVSADNIAKPLEITKEGLAGMYKNMSSHLLQEVQTKNLTYYHHVKTPDPKVFTENKNLVGNFSVAGWTKDTKVGPYVANIQGTVYPFFGNQFHPEKNAYEWKDDLVIPHSLDAMFIMQHYSSLLFNHSLLNTHSFESQNEFLEYSIYKTTPVHLEPNPSFEQIYFFENVKSQDSPMYAKYEMERWEDKRASKEMKEKLAHNSSYVKTHIYE